VKGLAIESATSHVEVLVADGARALAHVVEDVGHGHTRRLAPLIADALARAATRPAELRWVAADLGPGSFTGVRVGLATAEALALATGARLVGASSLAALAHGAHARRALVVPLVGAGRRDLYAGFFRADTRGQVSLVAAPQVGPADVLLDHVAEVRALLANAAVRFVGPGAAREREALERAHPGSTEPPHRAEGPSALDLAHAALSNGGPAAGLPPVDATPRPLYVRPAQAEERVRRRANAAEPIVLRPLREDDVPAVAAIEREVFSDPWPESFFHGELSQAMVVARIAEREGRIAGYSVAWLGAGVGHLGNLAVVPSQRRRGVARALLLDLLDRAREQGIESLTLEVRVSNLPAQALYRAHGFRLAGLRRAYYGDTREDALVMAWAPAGARVAAVR
jgi:tRNA threonylcarbamoyl adenosine modification protein YeaZ/ribosomal-protein-alanine acetyltransferase